MNFSKLDNFIKNIDVLGIPNCEIAVTYRHETVYHATSGYADVDKTRPASFDDAYFMYSATKVVTAVAVMQLVEQGKLSLKDPVKKFYPGYGRFIKTENGIAENTVDCTVEQLLSMQGGVTYDLNSPAMAAFRAANPHADTQAFLRAFVKEPLSFVPGTNFLYSMCLDIAGGIVELVSGERFGDYVQNHIAGPLGWQVCAFHPTDELKPRMPQLYIRNDSAQHTPGQGFLTPLPAGDPFGKNTYIVTDRYDSAGAGLITRVSDYMLMTDALANGGVGKNGTRILTPASIDEMRRNRLDTPKKFEQQALVMSDYGYGYGLAVRTMVDNRLSPSPVGEFGWDGAAGAYVLADPINRISITFAMSVLHYSGVKQAAHMRMRDMVYEALADEIAR